MSENIRLDDGDIKHLILGGELWTYEGSRIIMTDIGFDLLLQMVQDAPNLPTRLREVRSVAAVPHSATTGDKRAEAQQQSKTT